MHCVQRSMKKTLCHDTEEKHFNHFFLADHYMAHSPSGLCAGNVQFPFSTLDSIVNTLEKQLPVRFYFAPSQTDVAPKPRQKHKALDVLEKELHKNGFSFYHIGGTKWLILKGNLQQEIHQAFFKDSLENGRHKEEELSLMVQEEKITADSENRLYTLGNPELSGTEGIVRITGYIRDHVNGEPVSGMTVMTEDKKHYTMSDTYGFYSLTLPRGYNTLHIRGFGYKDSHRYVRVFSEGSLDLNIEEEVFSLQGIVISAENGKRRNVRLGLERVRADRIRHIPMAFGEADVIKAVLTLPSEIGWRSIRGFNVRVVPRIKIWCFTIRERFTTRRIFWSFSLCLTTT